MTQDARWTKPPAGKGVDPRDTDAEFQDEELAARRQQNRPVVNDQEPVGQQGISSDKPGDEHNYPEEP